MFLVKGNPFASPWTLESAKTAAATADTTEQTASSKHYHMWYFP